MVQMKAEVNRVSYKVRAMVYIYTVHLMKVRPVQSETAVQREL